MTISKPKAAVSALNLVFFIPFWILAFFLIFATAWEYHKWLTMEEYIQGGIRIASTTLAQDRRCLYDSQIFDDDARNLALPPVRWITNRPHEIGINQRIQPGGFSKPMVYYQFRIDINHPLIQQTIPITSAYVTNPDTFKSRGRWADYNTAERLCPTKLP
ncbi:MAG: hypothetical protein QXS54_00845 [Candidatus Methanomethylicaceae archaeon]